MPSDLTDDEHFYLADIFQNPFPLLAARPPLAEIARRCAYVLDTSTLIASYAFDQRTAKDIVKVYRGLASAQRLFFPERTVQEFLRNRHTAVTEAFDKVFGAISKFGLPALPKLPLLDEHQRYKEAAEAHAAAKAANEQYKKALNGLLDDLKHWRWDDEISALFAEVITGTTVVAPKGRKEDVVADLKRRTKLSLAPGFKDKDKSDGGIGDLLIWNCVLQVGRESKKDVIFVTHEKKFDWVIRTNDTVIAPQPTLVQEFHNACGQHFAVVGLADFLKLNDAGDEAVAVARGEETRWLTSQIAVEEFDHWVAAMTRYLRHSLSVGEERGEHQLMSTSDLRRYADHLTVLITRLLGAGVPDEIRDVAAVIEQRFHGMVEADERLASRLRRGEVVANEDMWLCRSDASGMLDVCEHYLKERANGRL